MADPVTKDQIAEAAIAWMRTLKREKKRFDRDASEQEKVESMSLLFDLAADLNRYLAENA